ncbi:MAG TPA: hypothetical protein VIY08_01800 [Candidatus Nitrosocosmicus sp.]
MIGISGEHNLSPVNESLSSCLEGLSPVLKKLSPEATEDLSTKSDDSGYNGYNVDN